MSSFWQKKGIAGNKARVWQGKRFKISKIGIDHHPGLQAMVLVFADKGDNYEGSLQRGKVTLLQFNDENDQSQP